MAGSLALLVGVQVRWLPVAGPAGDGRIRSIADALEHWPAAVPLQQVSPGVERYYQDLLSQILDARVAIRQTAGAGPWALEGITVLLLERHDRPYDPEEILPLGRMAQRVFGGVGSVEQRNEQALRLDLAPFVASDGGGTREARICALIATVDDVGLVAVGGEARLNALAEALAP